MSWVVTAVVASTVTGAYSAYQQGKANEEAQRKNEANIRAMLGSITEGYGKAELSLDEIMQLAEGRSGEEAKVRADYEKAEEQLEEGQRRSMGRLAGAEGQMQQQMQAMMEQALGGAIGGAPRSALGGGSMGMNMARMAAGGVMQSGMPLELTKLASAQESQYGTQRAGLTTAKSGATAGAREQYLGGMQQAHQAFANLEQWQADAIVGARSGIQYQAAQIPNYLQGLDLSGLPDYGEE